VIVSCHTMVIEERLLAVPSLLARVGAGDVNAVREIVTRYGNLVWSIARRYEAADAEDAVQEVFLDLWKSASRFDPAVASEATFIATITRRRLIDRRRNARRRPQNQTNEQPHELTLEEVASDGSSPATSAEASEAARALDQLRPEQRQVLVLSTCHGMSHSEISAQTGMPLGTVKAHARRGLSSIRAALLGVQKEKS